MCEPLWNMSAHPPQYNFLFQSSQEPFMEPNSNISFSAMVAQIEQDDPVRRAWIRPPPEPQTEFRSNPSLIPRTNPVQVRLPNLVENFADSEGTNSNYNLPSMRFEHTQSQEESLYNQGETQNEIASVLPVPLTIDPSVTHDREFWIQRRQSSLTSNYFTGTESLNPSGKSQIADSQAGEAEDGTLLTDNSNNAILPNLSNGENHQPSLQNPKINHFPLSPPPPPPDFVLLPAPTIRSDKVPIFSTDQMTPSWLSGPPSVTSMAQSIKKSEGTGDPYPYCSRLSGNHFEGMMNTMVPGIPAYPLSTSNLNSHHWRITSNIVLTVPDGDNGLNVHYPSNPRPEDVWHSLQEPNAPEFPNLSSATVNHLEFYEYGQLQVPRDQIMPAPPNDREPGVMPYNSPPMESYFHLNPKNRPVRQDEKLRFPSDLYTPRWVRGDGPAREGFCSLCEQGSWLQLKTSQYWYHVRFTHGVNSNTGKIYDPPLRLRICDDPLASIYGFCGECHQWIAICTPRRKRSFTPWFRHAHACHRFQHSMGHYLPFKDETSDATPAMSSDLDRTQIEDTPEKSVEELDETISLPPSHLESSHVPPAQSVSRTKISGDPLSPVEKGKIAQRSSWPTPTAGMSAFLSANQLLQFGNEMEVYAHTPLHQVTAGHRRSTSDGWLGSQNSNGLAKGSLINDTPQRPRASTSVKNSSLSGTKAQKPLRSRKKQSRILKSTKKK